MVAFRFLFYALLLAYFSTVGLSDEATSCRNSSVTNNNYCKCEASNCVKCVNKMICTQCPENFVLVDNKCLNCSESSVREIYNCNSEGFGFTSSFLEDGRIKVTFNRTYSHADNKDVDVKSVFKIQMGNETTFNPEILEVQEDPNRRDLYITLKMDRSFKNLSYNISIKPGKETFFYDPQNGFLADFDDKYVIQSYVHFGEGNDVEAISISTYVFEGLFLLVLIASFVSDSAYYVWPLLDLMQFLNLFYFLNVPMNPRLLAFLGALGITNLDFLPDLLYKLCRLIGRPDGDYSIYTNIPLRFLSDSKGNSFIKNFGDLFVFVIACFLLIMMLISFSKKQSKRKSYNVVTTVIIEGGKILEWTGFIKIMDTFLVFFSLCVGLRFKYLSFEVDAPFHAIDVTITALTLFFYFIFMVSLFRKINHPSVYLGEPEHYRKYGIVVENVDVKRFWPRNFFLIGFLQKTSLGILIPVLYDNEHQVLIISATQLAFTVLIIFSLPYGERVFNLILGFEEILKTLFLFLLLGICLTNKGLLEISNPGREVIFQEEEINKVRNLNLAALSIALLSFYLYWVFYIQNCITKTKAVRMDRAKITKKA